MVGHTCQLHKVVRHLFVIEHIPAENSAKLVKAEERREDQADKKALRTFSAPYIGRNLAAEVAASENRKIFFVRDEHFRDLEFRKRTQKTEIINARAEVFLLVFVEISLKLKAL